MVSAGSHRLVGMHWCLKYHEFSEPVISEITYFKLEFIYLFREFVYPRFIPRCYRRARQLQVQHLSSFRLLSLRTVFSTKKMLLFLYLMTYGFKII